MEIKFNDKNQLEVKKWGAGEGTYAFIQVKSANIPPFHLDKSILEWREAGTMLSG